MKIENFFLPIISTLCLFPWIIGFIYKYSNIILDYEIQYIIFIVVFSIIAIIFSIITIIKYYKNKLLEYYKTTIILSIITIIQSILIIIIGFILFGLILVGMSISSSELDANINLMYFPLTLTSNGTIEIENKQWVKFQGNYTLPITILEKNEIICNSSFSTNYNKTNQLIHISNCSLETNKNYSVKIGYQTPIKFQI